MRPGDVASESGRRSALPEAEATSLARAETLAGLRWVAPQLRGRSVLVVTDDERIADLSVLLEGGVDELLVLPAGPGAEAVACASLPVGARRLGGTLQALPDGVGGANALVWLAAPDDPAPAVARLDALLAALPPGAPVILGFSPAGAAALERVRSRLPRAREAACHMEIAALVVVDSDVARPSRRYLTTASDPPDASSPTSATTEIAGHHRWMELAAEQDARVAALERRLIEAQQTQRERAALQQHLMTAETELAQVPVLREVVDQLRHERDLMRQERDARVEEIERGRRVLADVMNSLSWRITRPLRALKPRRR